MRTFTRSQPRSLLSIARSKSARSRSRCCRLSIKRISQVSLGLSGRLAPSFFPAFHAGPCSTGSYDECPIVVLRRPGLAFRRTKRLGRFWPLAERLLVAAFDSFLPLAERRLSTQIRHYEGS